MTEEWWFWASFAVLYVMFGGVFSGLMDTKDRDFKVMDTLFWPFAVVGLVLSELWDGAYSLGQLFNSEVRRKKALTAEQLTEEEARTFKERQERSIRELEKANEIPPLPYVEPGTDDLWPPSGGIYREPAPKLPVGPGKLRKSLRPDLHGGTTRYCSDPACWCEGRLPYWHGGPAELVTGPPASQRGKNLDDIQAELERRIIAIRRVLVQMGPGSESGYLTWAEHEPIGTLESPRCVICGMDH